MVMRFVAFVSSLCGSVHLLGPLPCIGQVAPRDSAWHGNDMGAESGELAIARSVEHSSGPSHSLRLLTFLLLAQNADLARRSQWNSPASLQHRLDTSKASYISGESLGRRAIFSIVPPMLLMPASTVAKGGTIRFSGIYDDPLHPDCRRVIKPEGMGIVIIGTDELDGPEWKVYGRVNGDEVMIDFSPKGGPSEVVAQWVGGLESFTNPTPASLRFPDGNVWTRLNQADIVKAASYSGAYVFVLPGGKEALRRKVLMSGYTARIIGTDVMGGPEWEVNGKYVDGKLVIDFSSRGGPSDGILEKTSKGLLFPDGTVWKAVGPG